MKTIPNANYSNMLVLFFIELLHIHIYVFYVKLEYKY